MKARAQLQEEHLSEYNAVADKLQQQQREQQQEHAEEVSQLQQLVGAADEQLMRLAATGGMEADQRAMELNSQEGKSLALLAE